MATAFLLTSFGLLPTASAVTTSPGPASNPFITDLRAQAAQADATTSPVAPAALARAVAADRSVGPRTPSSPYTADGTLLAAARAPASRPPALRAYTVQGGDTLTGIADRFGLSMMSIWWSNTLASKDQLHVGQRLVIPPLDGVLYTAKAGDTVPTVAARFHADPAAITSYNGLATDELTLGEQVMIPDGVGPSIVVAPTTRPVAQSTGSSVRAAGSAAGGGCGDCGFAPLLWPVKGGGYISQRFGCTGFPYEPPFGACAHYHAGIDIAAPVGTQVVAAAAGTVEFAGWKDNDGGYQVTISDAHGYYTGYFHLSAFVVHAGQRVVRGQLIGRVGSTGHSTGPHLYFQVWIGPIWNGGRAVDPLDYF